MGEHVERLDRLKANRQNPFFAGVRDERSSDIAFATKTADVVSAGVKKASRTEGFEGDLGQTISGALAEIHLRLDEFSEYQERLRQLAIRASAVLDETAGGVEGLPAAELSPEQRSTVDFAAATRSPVQVSPGVSMTHTEAEQYYLDQAAAAQEEQARQMTAALDAQLQEIIDSMPTSEYDEPKPSDDPTDGDGPGGHTPVDYPGVNGGGSGTGGYEGPGVIGGGVDDNGNNNDGNDDDDKGTKKDPPVIVDPPTVDPPVVEPPVYPPRPETEWPDPNDTGDDTPRIDGGIDGVTGGGGGGTGLPGGLTGVTGGGGGGGAAGSVGGAGGIVGGAAAGLAGRLGGGGLMGGVGGIGGVGGVGGTGTAGGASGVVAQSGAANGGRSGMVGGAAAGGGAGGGSDKRNRRRGQDLLAFEVEPDDDQIAPDLGAAGAAGRSASDGREELGW